MVEDTLRHNLMENAPVDVEQWLEQTDTVLIPIGSTEKHGDHVPLGTDSYIALGVTEEAAKKADVPHTPLIPISYSPHHMGEVHREDEDYFVGGGLTFRGSTVRAIIEDIGRSLIYQGFDKLLFTCQHGSNDHVIDEVLRKLRYETGCFVGYYRTPGEGFMSPIEHLIDGPEEETPGWHSGEVETAMTMAYDEDLVKMDRAVEDSSHPAPWLPESFSKDEGKSVLSFEGAENISIPMEHHEYSDTATLGNPFRANVEKGKEMVDASSDHLAALTEEIEELDITVPDEKRAFDERAMS